MLVPIGEVVRRDRYELAASVDGREVQADAVLVGSDGARAQLAVPLQTIEVIEPNGLERADAQLAGTRWRLTCVESIGELVAQATCFLNSDITQL